MISAKKSKHELIKVLEDKKNKFLELLTEIEEAECGCIECYECH